MANVDISQITKPQALAALFKVDLSQDSFDPWGFDRDNGAGAAERAIAAVADFK